MSKILRPDYNRSILSISSSIMKNYGVSSNYNSLSELDDVLNDNYKNVIFLILDCLGKNVLEENLDEESFLRSNVLTYVTSVFPPTTAAATTAFHSGLSPYENGWIGWMPYFKKHDRMIELFSGRDFYTGEKVEGFDSDNLLEYETIYEKIVKKNPDIKYHQVFPDFVNKSIDFKMICESIKDICNNDDKNLISAYWTEPDSTIHRNGVSSSDVKTILKDIDKELSLLCSSIDDSIIIICADHGAKDVKEVYLNEIKEIDDCLLKSPAIESRFVSFFVKEDKKQEFKELLEKYFKNKYLLYTKEEFLEENLIGYGNKHPYIDDYFGDYIFIASDDVNVRYTTTGEYNDRFKADHSGITEEEMAVPVIVKVRKK